MAKTERAKPIRFLMLGGFLGAGKTTTIGRLARQLIGEGKKVALVTNDQAYDLVDTQTLRSQGFDVGEVAGACFCCKFDDLIETIDGLAEDAIPDWVIAEPVGSCTDLVATVIEPMRALWGDRFEMGPLVVLLKPGHAARILSDQPRRGVSPKAEYIFLKQLEEADAIAINKIDQLTDAEQARLFQWITQRFPQVPVIGISAREGTGFERLVALVHESAPHHSTLLDIDYERYAQGEAELGWLNCQVEARSDFPFELDRLVLALTQKIGASLADHEVAHLKVLGETQNDTAVANLVSSTSESELSLASEIKTTAARLLVNARVVASPHLLETTLDRVVGGMQAAWGMELVIKNLQTFRPAKPTPTHRRSPKRRGHLEP